MRILPTIACIVVIFILMIVVASLGGCAMTASFTLKCKGECEATVERKVESKEPPLPLSLEPRPEG